MCTLDNIITMKQLHGIPTIRNNVSKCEVWKVLKWKRYLIIQKSGDYINLFIVEHLCLKKE